jgi:DNA repair protein RadC
MKLTSKQFTHAKIVTIRACESPAPSVGTPAKVHGLWQDHVTKTEWYESSREQFVLLTMDTRHRATGLFLISVGTLSETLVHPREVLRPAIIANAWGIVIAHNHPSGDPSPSEADRGMTRKIRECADLFQIHLLDHLIIGDIEVANAPDRFDSMILRPTRRDSQPPYFSFKEHGLL